MGTAINDSSRKQANSENKYMGPGACMHVFSKVQTIKNSSQHPKNKKKKKIIKTTEKKQDNAK